MGGATADLLRQVHQLAARQATGSLTDRQLLERFTAGHEEAAFELLVRRHGPMVLGLCRRVLGHEQDAEDAVQAAFLLLARRAGSIRQVDVGGFLYRVAYHLALRARANAAKRKQREKRGGTMASADPTADLSWRDVRRVVDEELQRLPDSARSAVVLCCLEGKTHDEAARLLGWSKATLRRRLNEGRELLRTRLVSRGLAPMTSLTATLFAEGNMSAAVPAALAGAIVRAAASGDVPPAVVALMEAGGTLLSGGKAKAATVLLLAVSLLGGAGTWASRAMIAAAPTPSTDPPAARAEDKPSTAPPKLEAVTTIEIHGHVFDPEGKPKAGAKLFLLDKDQQITELGVSAKDGRFTAAVPKEALGHWNHYIIARSDGAGIDLVSLARWKPGAVFELRLVKDNAIRGRVVNTEGKPVAGARVAANDVNVYPHNSLDTFLAFWKNHQSGGPMMHGELRLGNAAGVLFAATTDAEGGFVLQGFGVERLVSLRVRGPGIADAELWIVNRPGFDPKPFNKATLDNTPKAVLELIGKGRQLHGPDVAVVAEAEKILRGIVKDADTGKGRPNVPVNLQGMVNAQVDGLQTRTDAAGRYEIRGARKAKSYLLEVPSEPATGYMGCQVRADDTPGYQPVSANLAVKKGVIITGKMIDQSTGKPVDGFVLADALQGNPFVKEHPEFSSAGRNPVMRTDPNGVFRIVGMSGPVLLMGGPSVTGAGFKYKNSVPDPKHNQYFQATPSYVAYSGFGGGWTPVQGNFFKVLEIKPDAKVIEQDIILERAPALTVQIQDAGGKPLAGVYVVGMTPEGHYPMYREETTCFAFGVQPGQPRLMIFYHSTRKLVGSITLNGDEKHPVAVKLVPAGAIKGRLLDADGKPLVGVRIDPRYQSRNADTMHRGLHEDKQIETDAKGAFAIDDVLPGLTFELSFRHGKRRFEREPKPAEATIQVEAGERRDLGAIQLKPLPE